MLDTIAAVRPKFITFTGADDRTDLEGMHALSARYPIEWGVLFSPGRQGRDPRYPGVEAADRLSRTGLRLSAHLCGGYADAVMSDGEVDVPVDLARFHRIQVNHLTPNTAAISGFGSMFGARCVAQFRGEAFPRNDAVDWMFDASGGRGLVPDEYPPHPGFEVGYAGGMTPGNVAMLVDRIAASGDYWIDMESGVRTNDRFDLDLCAQVCETIYGRR